MIKLKDLLTRLCEDAPANSVGLPSGISPPAEPNKTATNIPISRMKKVLRRPKPVE